MHLAVFGGTGGTGRHLIAAALGAGHTVTAAVREPSRLGMVHERLRVVRADVLDAASLDPVVAGVDAVASALGSPAGVPTTVYSTGSANVLTAMRGAAVRRFIGITAVPVAPRDEAGRFERLVLYPILYRLFGEGYADMARMERLLHDSDLDWTVVRPPRLTDKPPTGRYRIAIGERLPRARSISRADLGAAVLALIDDPRSVRATVTVAH